MNYHDYKTCIDSCLRCATICNHCASSCLAEEHVGMMANCIQLDMECSAICYTAAQLMSLGSERAREYCGFCAEICRACAEECRQHANEYCQECADACGECAALCREMAA
jgi:hypothetical protein